MPYPCEGKARDEAAHNEVIWADSTLDLVEGAERERKCLKLHKEAHTEHRPEQKMRQEMLTARDQEGRVGARTTNRAREERVQARSYSAAA